MCRVGCEGYRMGFLPTGVRPARSREIVERDRLDQTRHSSGGRLEIELENCGAAWPECAPKCAPKVHGAVRAAGYHWQATGMTLAFTGTKTRIP